MKRVLTHELPKPGRPVALPESEAAHLIRVLRLRDGDAIEALDGKGRSAEVVLRFRGGNPRIEFLRESPPTAPAGRAAIPPVALEIAVLKGEAMEWVIEKAVELGVQKVIPLLTERTVVQIRGKPPEAFRERWQKIADQALKQCGRLERLAVELPTALEILLAEQPAQDGARRLWFDEGGRESLPYLADYLAEPVSSAGVGVGPGAGPSHDLRLLVGPEGGWSDPERELLRACAATSATIPLSLGPWVLRAETAAIFAMSLATARFRSGVR